MMCHENGCNKRARYAEKYDERPKYCPIHGKKKGFINVHNKRCEEKECTKNPNFGIINGKATHCAEHGNKKGLVDVVHRRCIEKECDLRANYGPIGGKDKYCAIHGKKKGYINVKIKRCSEEGCDLHTSYGISGGKAEYCAMHGKKKGYVDVVHRRCIEKECDLRANYGPIDGKAKYCAIHGKKKGYVDVVHRRCIEKECYLRPSYGPIDGKAKYCANHGKKKGFIDIVNKRCVAACSFYVNHYDKSFASKINPENGKMELCYNCWTAMYPELSKRKVRKEQFILAEVQNQIPELQEYFLTWDCKIPGQSCVAFRPDMAWEINDTLLHIEIDEGGINHEDEDQRIVEIHSASNKKNHVCIRFNPDKSIDGSLPCMKQIMLSNGESVYDKNPKEWNKRMNILIPEVRNAYKNALVNKSVCGTRKLCF